MIGEAANASNQQSKQIVEQSGPADPVGSAQNGQQVQAYAFAQKEAVSAGSKLMVMRK